MLNEWTGERRGKIKPGKELCNLCAGKLKNSQDSALLNFNPSIPAADTKTWGHRSQMIRKKTPRGDNAHQ
jgi:hypothetical protein